MFRQYYFVVDLMGMDNTTLKETASLSDQIKRQ
jgi:Trm5-related predicted tRNA methylase